MKKDFQIRVSRMGMIGLTLILGFNLIFIGWFLWTYFESEDRLAHFSNEVINSNQNEVYQCKPGPWGELEYVKTTLEPPEELNMLQGYYPRPTQWILKGYRENQLREIFASVDLNPSQIHLLMACLEKGSKAGEWILNPPSEFVMQLNGKQRAALYSLLSRFPENIYQKLPYRFNRMDVNEWFSNSGLLPETLSLIKPFIYYRGTSALFSDLDVVMPLIPSMEERENFVRALARQDSLSLKMVIRPQSDENALLHYWGKGELEMEISPILHSFFEIPDEERFNIMLILPPLPRSLLYTYPLRTLESAPMFRDCHWTSLNFFNREAVPTLITPDQIRTAFEKNYRPVNGSPTFGDILILYTSDLTAVHSAVYIADDIFFTKNGVSPFLPWVLMKKDDMIAQFPSDTPLVEQYIRLKKYSSEEE